jgi:phage gp29-like protein
MMAHLMVQNFGLLAGLFIGIKPSQGYVSRSGLFRVLAWPFLFKNYGVRDIMEFLETYGLPSKLVNIPLVQLMLKK